VNKESERTRKVKEQAKKLENRKKMRNWEIK
jgi:hypothetical protein